jgi:protein TonB
MFDNLVESTSHKGDISRKGGFFLGTLAIYAVIGIALLVGSILWYDAKLESQSLELMTMVAPVPVQEAAQPEQQKQPEQAKPAEATPDRQVATRTEFVASNLDPTKVPEKVSAVASRIPPVPPGGAVIGRANTDPVGGPSGPVGPVGVGGGGGPVGGTAPPKPVVVADDPEPPPPTPKPDPPKRTAPISGGVLNGKAVSKPAPPYPAVAKAARASGTVVVQITVDEGGKVISASAVSGHPLLRQAAVQAAYQARFSPTLLSGQPVKVTGTITYNFNLQ